MKKFIIISLCLLSAIIASAITYWIKPQTVVTPTPTSSSYGIDICNSGYAIYDAERLVGVVPYYSCPALDRIIDEDNN